MKPAPVLVEDKALPLRLADLSSACELALGRVDQLHRKLSDGADRAHREILGDWHELDIVLTDFLSRASLLSAVHPDADYRTAAEQCGQRLENKATALSLSRELYASLQALPLREYDADTRRYIERQLQFMRRAGVERDDDTRQRIATLQEELTRLAQDYQRNIRTDTRYVEVSQDRLEGLPEDYRDAHPADENGRVRISTEYPDYFPAMMLAQDEQLRRDLYKAFLNRAYPANHEALQQILEKRSRLARLLGYQQYADLATEDTMMKNAGAAQAFLDHLNNLATKRANQDYQKLLNRLRLEQPGSTQTQVQDWQKNYLTELLKRTHYNIDSREIQRYFSYERVREGIFSMTERLFNISIRPWASAELWHGDVRAYEVLDHGRPIGRFFLDMHPRPGKYKHAAHFGIMRGLNERRLPVAALVCNFPATQNMSLRDVETMLHEFGHLLHHIFSGKQRWLGLSGISTEWDFVEAPSSMLEEWLWDYDTLRRFAIDEDGEVLPKELFDRMLEARDFGMGLWVRQQLFYSALSLHYHNRHPEEFRLRNLMEALQRSFSNFRYVPETHFYASFGHLVGYTALYYSYLWSQVIAEDMFQQFRDTDLYDPQVSARYRSIILESGSSRPAEQLIEEFLGRARSFDAFTQRLNQE